MAKKLKQQKKDNLQPRSPVVVILGHVDHGKSTILEAIKNFKITEKESGGITQHIGAYEVEHQSKKITFIDTPGHEAFSAMRSRGSNIADIALLVVAAEEGVMPQTKEAINSAKKAGVPIIVAINKMDKPEADPQRVKRELVQENILVESMAGKIPSVEISAKTGQKIDELLEIILLTAEIENLETDISKPAQGAVIESYLEPQRGPTATLLLKNGKLKIGDVVGTSSSFGEIRILENFQGKMIKQATPSMPVIVIGFEDAPKVGEEFKVFQEKIEAQKFSKGKNGLSGSGQVFVIKPEQKVLNLILKTDVLGSQEAIEGILKELPQEKIVLRILKKQVGEINESDIKLAQASKAVILGFRTKTNQNVLNLKEHLKIKILNFDIIYELSQGVRQIMEKLVGTEKKKVLLGKIKALAIFRQEKRRQIVGGKVIEGEIKKADLIEILRPASQQNGEEEKIGQGKLINLQKNKKNAERAIKGEECGILYEGDIKIEEGDILEIYIEERQRGEL